MKSACAIACFLCLGWAQVPDNSLTFEVASIKLHDPSGSGQSSQKGGPGTSDPGRITATYRPLRTLLLNAFAIKTYQLQLPAALEEARYDISAAVPSGSTREQARAMMRNLLIQRLGLKIHRESKPMQVFVLVVAKGGAKLQPSADGPSMNLPKSADGKVDFDGYPVVSIDPVKGGMAETFKDLNAKLVAIKQTMAQLVAQLEGHLEAPVIDQTGLGGKYDFSIRYAGLWRRAGSFGQSEGDVIEGDGPKLTEVLEKELGLKLEPRKMPVEMVIVDAGQKNPIAN